MAVSDAKQGQTHSKQQIVSANKMIGQFTSVLRSLPATSERDLGMGKRVDRVDTAATVKKKFQCTPYSLACSWYSNVFTLYRRTSPANENMNAASVLLFVIKLIVGHLHQQLVHCIQEQA